MRVREICGIGALVLGLAVAFLLHGRIAAPPVYDGIAIPLQPYNYESPPPSVRNGNKPPESGEATLPIQNGQVAGGGVQTGDAQVIMYFGPGAFKAPPEATSVKCTITPVANPPPPPSGQVIQGNVYNIGCAAQPGGGPVTLSSTFHLTLRLPPGRTNDIQYYDGQSWHKLNTLFAPSGDPYGSVNAPAFGQYAAMVRSGAQGSGGNLFADLGRYLEFYGIIAFVIIFGVIAIIQEVRRRRSQRSARPRAKR